MTAMSDEVRSRVAEIARADRLLVALDFDGTLSHLHDDPMAVRAVPGAAAALDVLAGLPDTWVALVSGRTIEALRTIAEHGDDSGWWLAGSHGAEYWRPGEGPSSVQPTDDELRENESLQREIAERTAGIVGAWIEPKRFGFAVHTRACSTEDESRARELADALVAERASAWRRRLGRNVLEFAWRHEGKDRAVGELRDQLGATAVLFGGDDVTDEDALRSLRPGDLGVHVGDGRDTAATVVVPDPETLVLLLQELGTVRAHVSGVSART